LVKRRYVHTVLTTNFDQLVLQGIIKTGLLPVIADGLESLTRVTSQPKIPQVVHLHGSMHTYNMLNSERAVQETERELPLGAMLYRLLQDSKMLVIVGYSGGEEGVMKLLIESTKKFKDMMIYWVMFDKGIDSLSERAKDLLKIGRNKFIIPDISADKLFAELAEELKIGAPEWMEEPINLQLKNLNEFAASDVPDIEEKIKDYKEKIKLLEECWTETEQKHSNWLNQVVTLRLKGQHEKALQILRLHENSKDPYIWRMRAESANEVGQPSSDRRLIEESIQAWNHILKLESKAGKSDVRFEAQKGLGQTLQSLYEINNNKKVLESAVEAYRNALREIDKDKENAKWAETQQLLGGALQNLGDETRKKEYLEQAIEACQEALKVYTIKSSPLDWAEIQVSLGDAFQTLGNISKNTDLLEKSVEVYNSALSVYTRDAVPMDWAETQAHLGGAYQSLGKIQTDTSILEKAVTVYQKALDVYREYKEIENGKAVEENLNEARQEIENLKGFSNL